MDTAAGPSSGSSSVDIGRVARWSVSSHKYGYNVNSLRDNNPDTFWQSEGPQPHYIDLAFTKKVYVSSIQISCSHSQDDSYTPKRVSIAAGTGLHDVIEVRTFDMERPEGWISVPLRPINIDDPHAEEPSEGEQKKQIEIEGPPIPANYLRIQVLENHLNGKDTHVRGLRVFGTPGSSYSAHERLIPAKIMPARTSPTENINEATSTENLTPRLTPARPVVVMPGLPAKTVASSKSSATLLRGGKRTLNSGEQAAITSPQPANPLDDPAVAHGLKWMELGHDGLSDFTTLEFKMHETIR